jgi:putative nucleotidyltransferase with HDIG domain
VIIVFLTYTIAYLCYKTINTAGVSGVRTLMFAYFAASSILTLLIYPLMIIIERTFGFISSVTLIELSNLNSKLLQRMSQEAPGTFQHSMQVGNLAAEAAIAIGANPLEVRTGAMYHDIGKLENPIYFTENQNGGVSPHSSLTPIESAQVIIKHVTDGLATAEREGLPKKIKEFIATHHGDSKVGYFYITYKNEHPGEEIDEKLFTYPGPKPSTKEQAVLMLADCVEAASHSLKEYTEENINKLVDNIVGAKLNEGELSMSPITFGDVDTIKTVFKKRLMAIYHTRISYPKEKE